MIRTTNKNKLIITMMLFLVAVLGLSACSDRPDEIDTSLKVGNILLSDNSVISPKDYNRENSNAVGVIFYVSKDTTLVVSSRELGKYAYSDSVSTIGNVTNDATSLCGKENTAALLTSGVHCPGAEAAAAYVSPVAGWALPSAGELLSLAAVLPTVSRSLEVIGGDPFTTEQYLSSSQDGASSESTKMFYLAVSLGNGFVTSVNKLTEGRVRAVLRLR